MDPYLKFHITGDASELDSELNQLLDNLYKTKEASQEAGKSHGFLSLKTGELKSLTRELGREFPIAGQAARMMMNPMVASLTAGIMAFSQAKKELEEWNKEMDATAARNANSDWLPGIEAKKAALNEMGVSLANFNANLDATAKHEKTFSDRVGDAITKLHEFAVAQAEVNNAAQANELAGVNLAEKEGRISPEQATMQRAGISRRYRKLADEQKTKEENAELALQQQELATLQQQLPGLQGVHDAKATTKGETIARVNELKAIIASAEESIRAGKEEAKRLQGLNENADVQDTALAGGFVTGKKMTRREEEIEVIKAQASKSRGLIAAAEREKRRLETQVLPGQLADEEQSRDVVDKAAKRISTLQGEIGPKAEILGIRQQGRQVVSGLKDETEAKDTAASLVGMRQSTEKQLEAANRSAAEAVERGQDVLPGLVRNIQKFHEEIDNINRALDVMNSRSKNSR